MYNLRCQLSIYFCWLLQIDDNGRRGTGGYLLDPCPSPSQAAVQKYAFTTLQNEEKISGNYSYHQGQTTHDLPVLAITQPGT